jgi:hypothetical protein
VALGGREVGARGSRESRLGNVREMPAQRPDADRTLRNDGMIRTVVRPLRSFGVTSSEVDLEVIQPWLIIDQNGDAFKPLRSRHWMSKNNTQTARRS